MSCDVLIVGLPPFAGCASTKTWRAAADLVHSRLRDRFGAAVRFEYIDIFSPEMAHHPEVQALVIDGSIPPLVLIDGVARFAGGKLHISAIERAVAETLYTGVPAPSPIKVFVP
jgi:disulfide oxidoreductase YuzD